MGTFEKSLSGYGGTSARIIDRIVAHAPDTNAILSAFGGAPRLSMVLHALDMMDQSSPQGVEYLFEWEPGENPDHAGARLMSLTAQADRGERPSLVMVAGAWLRVFGIDAESSAARLVFLTAARAEMFAGNPPQSARPGPEEPAYHNRTHFLQVLQIACHLAQAQAAMGLKLDNRDICLLMVAALGHDIDHSGRSNPKHPDTQMPIRFYNEDASSAPLFQLARGLYGDMGAEYAILARTLIRYTDPGSPNQDLREAMARATRGEQAIRHPDYVVRDDNGFWSCAAILADADLLYSAGIGKEANIENARKLTQEAKKAGLTMDFTTAAAQRYFFDHIVSKDGFLSLPARRLFNDSYFRLRRDNETAMAPTAPQAGTPAIAP